MKVSKSAAGIFLLLACVVGVFALKVLSSRHGVDGGVDRQVLTARMKGDPKGKIKIVEFTDFQCPACAKADEKVREMFEKYPGQLFLELKYFPLATMHPFAIRAATYAECAARQGKFWPFQDVLFKTQTSWAKMTTVDEYFSGLAVGVGMDGASLAACVNDASVERAIRENMDQGQSLGVGSTPTFFVNGKMAVGGKNFAEAVDQAMGGGQ